MKDGSFRNVHCRGMALLPATVWSLELASSCPDRAESTAEARSLEKLEQPRASSRVPDGRQFEEAGSRNGWQGG